MNIFVVSAVVWNVRSNFWKSPSWFLTSSSPNDEIFLPMHPYLVSNQLVSCPGHYCFRFPKISFEKSLFFQCFEHGAKRSTSPPGGNQVDGLPPALSFVSISLGTILLVVFLQYLHKKSFLETASMWLVPALVRSIRVPWKTCPCQNALFTTFENLNFFSRFSKLSSPSNERFDWKDPHWISNQLVSGPEH